MEISRERYAELFGPTTGDRVRLADTSLIIEVERDDTVYGDECVFGGGKTLRDGLGMAAGVTAADGALDLVITNVLLVDPVQGIEKPTLVSKTEKSSASAKRATPASWKGSPQTSSLAPTPMYAQVKGSLLPLVD